MAATDTFENFASSLSAKDRESLKDYIKQCRDELFAARSEEARLRIVYDFVAEVYEKLKQ